MTHKAPKWLKPVVDYLPLVVFLAAYLTGGMMKATIALMAATLFVLTLSLVFERRIPAIPLVTALVVGVFGGLTLWFQDETFIKMKPTIVYLLFGALIGGGLLFKKPLLKMVMNGAFQMDDQGWSRLSQRFCAFFVVMAIANEIVWRNFSTDLWMFWKFPGSVVIMFAFMLCQIGLMQRHKLADLE